MKIEYTIKFIVKCKKEYLSIFLTYKKAMDCYCIYRYLCRKPTHYSLLYFSACYYNLNLFFIYFYVKRLLAIYKSLYYYYVTTN